MSKIKAGDLVMVVKPTLCCGATDGVGRIYTATEVDTCCETFCLFCGADTSGTLIIDHDDDGFSEQEVVKIDPPTEALEAQAKVIRVKKKRRPLEHVEALTK